MGLVNNSKLFCPFILGKIGQENKKMLKNLNFLQRG